MVALEVPAHFQVGDRVECWSDSYGQWVPGTVQRARDAGLAYDLDVRRGALASKLRPAERHGAGAGELAPRRPGTLLPRRERSGAPAEAERPRREEPPALAPACAGVPAGAAPGTCGPAAGSTASLLGDVAVREALQGFEGALTGRVAFAARCFHAWRFQSRLDQASGELLAAMERQRRELAGRAEQCRARHGEHLEEVVRALARGEALGASRACLRGWRQAAAVERWGRALEDAERARQREVANLARLAVERLWAARERNLRRAALRDWRRAAEREADARRRAEVLLAAILGALDGDRRAVLREVFAPWSRLVGMPAEARLGRWLLAEGRCSEADAVRGSSLARRIASAALCEVCGPLLAPCLSEWRLAASELRRAREAERSLGDLHVRADGLLRDKADLQEQLSQAYQQIELVSATLQKELRAKEELAGELSAAYGRLRASAAAAAGACAAAAAPPARGVVPPKEEALKTPPSTQGPQSLLSRDSSEQTLQLPSSPRPAAA